MIVNQYFSTIPSVRYVFKNGTYAYFVAGRYRTHKVKEIEELDAEILEGHPHIYVKKDEAVVDTKNDDPLAGLRRKIIDDYIKEQQATRDAALDLSKQSTSDNAVGDLNMVNSGGTQQAQIVTSVKPEQIKAAITNLTTK